MRLRVIQIAFNKRLFVFEIAVFVVDRFTPFLRLPGIQAVYHLVIRKNATLAHCIVHFTDIVGERFLNELPQFRVSAIPDILIANRILYLYIIKKLNYGLVVNRDKGIVIIEDKRPLAVTNPGEEHIFGTLVGHTKCKGDECVENNIVLIKVLTELRLEFLYVTLTAMYPFKYFPDIGYISIAVRIPGFNIVFPSGHITGFK